MYATKLLPPPNTQELPSSACFTDPRHFMRTAPPVFCACQRGLARYSFIPGKTQKIPGKPVCSDCATEFARSLPIQKKATLITLNERGLVEKGDFDQWFGGGTLAQRQLVSSEIRTLQLTRSLLRGSRAQNRPNVQATENHGRIEKMAISRKYTAQTANAMTVFSSGVSTYSIYHSVTESVAYDKYSKSYHRRYGPSRTIDHQEVTLRRLDLYGNWQVIDQEQISKATAKQLREAAQTLAARNEEIFKNAVEISSKI